MGEANRRSARLELKIPIRVRGMSAQNKFFDEQAETIMVSQHGLMTRLRCLVELETEVHVVNLRNNIGGTYRVVWVNTRGNNGLFDAGLEMIETEGDAWEVRYPQGAIQEHDVVAEAWLECRKCHKKALVQVPEAEYEFLREGFMIARHCETCKATTAWDITTEGELPPPAPEPVAAPEPEPPPQPQAPAPPVGVPRAQETSRGAEKRTKGRAPIKMHIKVTRMKYGTQLVDLCDTINVSRNGAYFLSSQNYDVGEGIEVVMPHVEGDLAIPAPANVVRVDQPKDIFQHAVAIHFAEKKR